MSAWLDAFVPAFGLLALGAVLKRVLLPDDRVWAGMERLIYWVLLPALIVAALAQVDLATLPLGRIVVVIWGALGIGTALALMVARGLRQDHGAMTSILMGGIRFNNLVGFAVAGALFGGEGIVMAAVATGVIVPFVQFVTTAAFAIGGRGAAFRPLEVARQIALNPLIIACALGFGIAALGGLPPGIGPTVQALGRASVALGLLCVGAALTAESFSDRPLLQFLTGFQKLVIMPALTLALCRLFGLEGLTVTIAVMFMALPTAATSYVMSRAMGGDAKLMAAITTTEHVAAVITLPLWILWLGL
ncbi:MAG TPA: AEC family transporter [Acetobacteraceae bacterium]|nr:AEC family transporter [Acetobacteraceae bacterium]